MTDYRVEARRVDHHGSLAIAKEAEVVLDTDMAGQLDAMNPVELLLASLASCILKGTERVIPMLHFDLRGVEVSLRGVRHDRPPKIITIRYEITVDTDETDARLALLHKNLQRFGTIYNTLAGTTDLSGTIRRKLC
ncbi:OsmC family protein [Albirhodobacter sp. R86504]|uniref:OsmC family protein n=1 Tax=Albirhodobacter sp. R86504 TaxID=3093848 RepID=UPI0036702689